MMGFKVFSCIILQCTITREGTSWFKKRKITHGAIDFTLRQIQEQSNDSSLYGMFVDFEKAFDSHEGDSLWKFLRLYGIPQKLVNIIKSLYGDFECRVIHDNQLTEPFKVNTVVKQGGIFSPQLFSLAIDWLVHIVTDGKRQKIPLTMSSVLEDLDYAHDLGLL